MELLYKEAKGMVDVSKSKADLALRREGYLTEQVRRVADSFKCEYSTRSRVLLRCCSPCDSCCVLAVIQFDPVMEQRRVASRLSSDQHTTGDLESSFWADRGRGHVLALLEVRAQQLEDFFASCKDSLAAVYETMYPLDAQPDRLYLLIRQFSNRDAMEGHVTAMRISGAEAALSMIRIYIPDVNLNVLSGPLPPSPSGGDWQMEPIYREVRGLAVLITRRFAYEDARLRMLRREEQATEEERQRARLWREGERELRRFRHRREHGADAGSSGAP